MSFCSWPLLFFFPGLYGGASAMVEQPGNFYGSGKCVVLFLLGWLLPAAYARMSQQPAMHSVTTNMFS
jgi:hypothetical protein